MQKMGAIFSFFVLNCFSWVNQTSFWYTPAN